MIVGNYEKYCKNFHLCSGYEKALKSRRNYFLHHIQGEKISREELIENDSYYDCAPENLRWVTKSEHQKIHMTGKNNPNFGRIFSDETRRKMSEARKGRFKGENNPNFGKKGKKRSDETKQKISEANKGMPKPSGPKGMSWKLVDGKRIYYKKYEQIVLDLGVINKI